MADKQPDLTVANLQASVAALTELLTVHEKVVIEQSARLAAAIEERDANLRQRKLAEEQLRRYAAELARANEEVKTFAYIVSHDLRAPLINVKGFASELRTSLGRLGLVLDAALPHLTAQQQQEVKVTLREDIPEALNFIESSAGRMDSLVNALLKLSRLGRRELTLERFNLNEVVQRVTEGLAHQIKARGAIVSVGALPEVTADRTCMEQIVANILTNAVNYLDPARPGRIEIEGESGPDEVTLSVRDNGRGIAQEDMHKVFAPFQRAGQQNVPGEGMGLAYVQTIARRHGGFIRCESQPGVGSTFTVTISTHPEQRGGDVRDTKDG